VQDIKAIFPSNEFNIFPIVFLRDDIYEIVSDPDKNKWSDFISEVSWDDSQIKELLSFRISRSISPDHEILDFNTAWKLVFDGRC
jgi:hypothetical protein